MTRSYSKRLITGLLGLYIGQGIPFGVAMFAVPGIMRSLGASMAELGAFALVMLPWALKIFWASQVDRRVLPGHQSGESHYLGWVRVMQVLGMLTLAAMFVIDPVQDFYLLVVILLLVTTFQSTQDIAVDALAVQLAKQGDKQNLNANGVQIGGFSAGMLIGGSGSLLVFEALGWYGMIAYLMTLLLLSYAPFHLWQSLWQQQLTVTETCHRASLRRAFKNPAGWQIIPVAFLFKFAGGMGEGLLTPLLVDQQTPLFWISVITGTAMMTTMMLAAWLATRLGRIFDLTTLATGALLISAACWAVLGSSLFFHSSPVVTAIGMIVEWLFANIACVAFFALFMRWCNPEQAGTDFSLLQCNEALGGVIGMSLGATLAQYFGFANSFLIAAVSGVIFTLIILMLLKRCFRTEQHDVQVMES